MTRALSVRLSDLKRAYDRVREDRKDKSFVEHPFLFAWAEIDRKEWFEQLQARLDSDFNPHPSRLCWVPKANSLLRPAHVLHLKDEVVYNLIVDRLYEPIWRLIGNYQGQPDAAYVMQEPGNGEWFGRQFHAWEEFREESLRRLHKGATFIVASDITGFYENIDIGRLLSELRQIADGMRPEIELLGKCLRKWSSRGDKGIPQGYSASDILAKVYMHSVDVGIETDAFSYLRYVDDIRIFCHSELEAKRAIQSLSRHVHGKGLNLQSAKTKILTRKHASKEFNGVKRVVEEIRDELIAEILDGISVRDPYDNSEDAQLTIETRDDLPPEVLERAFTKYFAGTSPIPFEKTLFHYLLNRLAQASSRITVSYCMKALTDRPEETPHILKYLARVALQKREVKALGAFLVSPAAMYDYQVYEILKWLFDEKKGSSEAIAFCRQAVQDHNRDIWLRSYALAYLGKFGRIEDLQLIESLYSRCSSDMERADCVMAMMKMEPGKRNAFYGAAQRDGALTARAIALAKKASGIHVTP